MKTQRATALAVQEKRRERRYPTNDPVHVRKFPFAADTIPAKIVDVSRSGMKLELGTPLLRDVKVEVTMLASKAVIFGEVRHCRRSGAVYHAGVLIEDVVQPASDKTHVNVDDMSLYVVGKGLSAADVLRVEEHLSRCPACKTRLVQATKTLYPTRLRLTPRQDIAL